MQVQRESAKSLSQASSIDSNQQAKKKRNNAVTRDERGNEKGVVKKKAGGRERKTRATPHGRVVIDIKRAACRAARLRRWVSSCWLAIVITRCREHMRRGWTMASSHEESGTKHGDE